MTFTDEVKAANSAPHVAKPAPSPASAAQPAPATEPAATAAPAAPAAATPAAPAEPALMSPTLDGVQPAAADALPGGIAPLDPAVKAADDARRDLEAKAAAKANAKITIAGKDFASIDEAIAYAEQLEIANREQKAFQEGVEIAAKVASPKADAPPPEPTFIQKAKDLMFEDPEKAIALIVEGTQKQVFDAYGKMTEQQQLQAARQQSTQAMWQDFYSKNADLADIPDFVEFTRNKYWNEIKDVPLDTGLAKLAELARKGAKLTKDSALPATELQSGPAITAGASSQATGKNNEATEPVSVDFVSQLNKIRSRSKA